MNAASHFVDLRGLRFHYIEWGRPDAIPLVALHGLRSYAETFEALAAALGDGYRVISVDQRGRGRSDWDPERRYDTLTYVADLEALIDHLGLTRFHLLGHSMGGANAIVYAGEHPDKVASLIVEDMGPGASASSDGAARIKRELANTPDSFPDWDSGARFWRSMRPNVTEAAIASRVEHSMMDDGTGRIVWRHDQAGIAAARLSIPPIDLWPYALAICCPILLLRGAQSDFLSEATAVAMAERLPKLTHVPVEGAGHYVHDDAPEFFNATVRRFLDAQAL